MKLQTFIFYVLIFMSSYGMAQTNFTLSPTTPQPGDTISFTYSPPEDFLMPEEQLRCDAYKYGIYPEQMVADSSPLKIELINLTKMGNTYTGQLTTDAQIRYLALTFTVGDVEIGFSKGGQIVVESGKIDTNSNQGYGTFFYEDSEQELPYANLLAANSFFALGITNNEKAQQLYDRELVLNPPQKSSILPSLLYNLTNSDPALAMNRARTELEKLFKNSLATEDDFMLAGALFRFAGLRNTATYFLEDGKEKFKNANQLFSAMALKEGLYMVEDPVEQGERVRLMKKIYDSASPEDKIFKYQSNGINPSYYHQLYLINLAKNGQTKALKTALENTQLFPFNFMGTVMWAGITDPLIEQKDPNVIAFLDQQFDFVLKRFKSLRAAPDQLPANFLEETLTTQKRMNEVTDRLAYLYYQYARYNYNTGAFKKGLSYAKKAYQLVEDRNFKFNWATKINELYLLLTEKVSPNKSKALIEKFVIANSYMPEMIEKLKIIYKAEHKSDTGFDAYYLTMLKENSNIEQEVAAMMINKPAPDFTLLNLEGEKVTLEDLKGKIVLLDFWATWCGPCIASFPAMSKLQDAFKENKEVVFLFVNTSETGFKSEAELSQRVVSFFKDKPYDFEVLIDAQNIVNTDYNASALPTKVLIDKHGNIRYKIVGAETDEHKLILEINAMIASIK